MCKFKHITQEIFNFFFLTVLAIPFIAQDYSIESLNLSKLKTFDDLCARIKRGVQEERSDQETYSDKEFSFFASSAIFEIGVDLSGVNGPLSNGSN